MTQKLIGDPDVRTDPVRPGEYADMQVEYWKMQYDLACEQANQLRRERDFYKEELERLYARIQESGQTAI